MSKKTPTERHNSGFWVPDRFVKDHLEAIRPTGACVYLMIAACQGLDAYPNHHQIAARLNLNPEFVRDAVLRLSRRGLITPDEMVKLIGSPTALDDFHNSLTPAQQLELDTLEDPT